MNEGQALVLGRRAKRCARWKWAPGMLAFAPRPHGAGAPETGPVYKRLVDTGGHPSLASLGDEHLIDYRLMKFPTVLVPDFRDPATSGWLLALVRDTWPTAPATTARFTYHSPERGPYSGWACTYWRPDDSVNRGAWIQAQGETEAEALVAALEAAGTR